MKIVPSVSGNGVHVKGKVDGIYNYRSIATLGFGVAVSQLSAVWEGLTGGYQGMNVPAASILGFRFNTDLRFHCLALVVTWALVAAAQNLLCTRPGRALMAIRDSEVAAQAMGISLAKYKTASFAISAFYAGWLEACTPTW